MSLEANPCEAALSAAGLKADEEGWYSGAQLRDYNKVLMIGDFVENTTTATRSGTE